METARKFLTPTECLSKYLPLELLWETHRSYSKVTNYSIILLFTMDSCCCDDFIYPAH